MNNNAVFVASKSDSFGWLPIGCLSKDNGLFTFVYTEGARRFNKAPIIGFDNFEQVYQSETLFPFFKNRILSEKRKSYSEFLSWIGVDTNIERPDPISILSVTEGIKETDNYEIFPCPMPCKEEGSYRFRFFVHGIRHLEEALQSAVRKLKTDDVLFPVLDICNEYDPSAVALRTNDNYIVGYLPRYMTTDAWTLFNNCNPQRIDIRVYQNNEFAPSRMQLLCEMTACWPEGFKPFNEEKFKPITKFNSKQCGFSDKAA